MKIFLKYKEFIDIEICMEFLFGFSINLKNLKKIKSLKKKLF